MIGVAITTHNRPKVLGKALRAWSALLPDDAFLAVVDDASLASVHSAQAPLVRQIAHTYYRFDTNVGVAAAKNKSIELLMDAGAEHLFLVDDDVWPVTRGWHIPYVHDEEPHLMLCWGRSRLVEVTDAHTVWSWPRGVVLYAERRVVETVGGMHVEFGKMGNEHVEWSNRIHNAGLTTHRFGDVIGSKDLWHAEDWGRPGESHTELAKRRAEASTVNRPGTGKRRARLMRQFEGSTDFVEYRSL